MIIENLYRLAWNTPSDINTLLPILAGYAGKCRHVTEFGTRTGVSTTAFVYARPSHLVCYDINPECAKVVRKLADGWPPLVARFVAADTSKLTEIEVTDLLFIDSLHTGEQLAAELRMSKFVRKYILMHDTLTFGTVGEDGKPGLLSVITQFVAEHPEWVVEYETKASNGLTVLRRIK